MVTGNLNITHFSLEEIYKSTEGNDGLGKLGLVGEKDSLEYVDSSTSK